MASQPSLRIGNAERDAVAAELREHYAHGRLTLEEFSNRLDATFAAKTQRDLSQITRDLPHVRPDDVPLPSSHVGRPPARVTPVRPASYPPGDDWNRGRRHHRGGFASMSTLLAALAAWLLVYDVILVGLHWPLAGRLGLLFAIFAVLRGLLRRIFSLGHAARGPRRRC